MIKVHNVIPLTEIFHKEESSIHCIGSKDPRKNHTPLLYYGDIRTQTPTSENIYNIMPAEVEQTTFTYTLSGSMEYTRENKTYLNSGSLFINQTKEEEPAQQMIMMEPRVQFIQIRIPKRYQVKPSEENSLYISPNLISNYKDPIKEFRKLYLHLSQPDGENFYLWHLSVVPNGRLHIPIPVIGRNFAFVFKGQGCFEDSEKPVHRLNMISFESQKMGNELNIWNISGSSSFEFLLLGSSGYKI